MGTAYDGFSRHPLGAAGAAMTSSVMRTRIDRFVEDALSDFAEWYASSDWRGKERDCVNQFALVFLAQRVQPGAAISHLGQIRIECAVPQPARYVRKPGRPAACKDLVIWREPLDTAWAGSWEPTNSPRVVMEWKTLRSGNFRDGFDRHDERWLTAFTRENPKSLGYLVQVTDNGATRRVDWAKVARGAVIPVNRRT